MRDAYKYSTPKELFSISTVWHVVVMHHHLICTVRVILTLSKLVISYNISFIQWQAYCLILVDWNRMTNSGCPVAENWPTHNYHDSIELSIEPSGDCPDSKVHGTNMGPTWVLSAPDGPHVDPMSLAIKVDWWPIKHSLHLQKQCIEVTHCFHAMLMLLVGFCGLSVPIPESVRNDHHVDADLLIIT